MFHRSGASAGAVTVAPVAAAEPSAVRVRSRKAIVSLILALLGLVLGMAGVWIVTTPVVLVLGSFALRDIRHGRAVKGRVMTWFAIALAIIGPLFWLWALVQVYSGIGSGVGLD